MANDDMILSFIEGDKKLELSIKGYEFDEYFKQIKVEFDTSDQGGAPLLGLNGLVVKAHGSSSSVEITQAIRQCIQFNEEKINEKIKENLIIE